MKILMFFPGHVEHLPPLITAAKSMSDLGAEVNIVATSASEFIINYFNKSNIKISVLDNSHPNSKINRGFNRFKILSLLLKEKNLFKPNFLWFHGPFSCKYGFIPSIIKKVRLIYHAYELCTNEKLLKFMHYYFISISDFVIVPEQNRINILSNKFYKTLFFYIPNIPLGDLMKYVKPGSTKKIFQDNGGSIKCTKFLIYQGAFMEDRCLYEIIDAFKLIADNKLGLILMGANQKDYIYFKLKELINIDNRIIIIPRIEYPHHMGVTSGCLGGFLLYKPNKLNNIFCAPNKIYEYTSLGLGLIHSDSLGLKYLKSYSIGYSCDPVDPLSIKDAIQKLLRMNKTELYNKSKYFYKQIPAPSSYFYPLFIQFKKLVK